MTIPITVNERVKELKVITKKVLNGSARELLNWWFKVLGTSQPTQCSCDSHSKPVRNIPIYR